MTKKPLVLLIDDDEWLRDQFSRLLKQAGYATHSASNALEGIDAIDRLHPRVIVLDVFMPGPNGIVLLHEIRSHSDLSQIPIIVCSNSSVDIGKDTLVAYGVSAILDKTTMHPEDIVVAVQKVIV